MSTLRFPIFWLTGNSGAGKSTIAFAFQAACNSDLPSDHAFAKRVIVLDGDEMRATISIDETLSAEDRRKHNLRVARLASHLQDQGFLVLVSVIAPFAEVREELDRICSPKWIYVKREGLASEEKPYEAPEQPDCTLDHDALSEEESLMELSRFIEERAL